jgi:hypothetical protein
MMRCHAREKVWLWNRRSVVRAHPTVPLQKIPCSCSNILIRLDLFARAKYKRRIQMALRMVALVRAKDGSWFAPQGHPGRRPLAFAGKPHLRLPKDTPHHEAKTRCAEWIDQQLLSIRCCLMRPIVPLFNNDRERCAALAELSRSPGGNLSLPERYFYISGFRLNGYPHL